LKLSEKREVQHVFGGGAQEKKRKLVLADILGTRSEKKGGGCMGKIWGRMPTRRAERGGGKRVTRTGNISGDEGVTGKKKP